jgi:hypothetical protein
MADVLTDREFFRRYSQTDCCAVDSLTYTSAMTRFILASFGLVLFLPGAAAAQVKIDLDAKHYVLQEKIHAKVENTGNLPITVCVEIGQTSTKGGETESTPSPFFVQQKGNRNWGTLMIGPDVGSIRTAVVLTAGESKEFAFRLSVSGELRLRLNYWQGSIPKMNCNASPKGSKLATSAVFTIE